MAKCYLTLISVCCIWSVSGRRSLQNQIDILEERFDNNFVQFKDEFRTLWSYIDSRGNDCCTNTTKIVSTSSKKDLPDDTVAYETFVKAVNEKLLSAKLGIQHEKRYVRDTINTLQKLIDRQNSTTSQQIELVTNNIRESLSDIAKFMQSAQDERKDFQSQLESVKAMNNILAVHMSQIRATFEHDFHPRSCIDIARTSTANGTYTLYNTNNQPFSVYCMFESNTKRGLTFISPNTIFNVETYNLYNVYDRAVIMYRSQNGEQYMTSISQIERNKNIPMSIQFNANDGYATIVNRNMGPYMYLGLTPVYMKGDRGKQGYSANSKEYIFANCDGNPNGYFAFLFNHNKIGEVNKYASLVATQWKTSGTLWPETDRIPDGFFSNFELHFGGCGAFASSRHFADVSGAALGIPFEVTCSLPNILGVDISYIDGDSETIKPGTTVIYKCKDKLSLLSGSLIRKCLPSGLWSDTVPVCVPQAILPEQ